MTIPDWESIHIGRSFGGPGRVEWGCDCPKAACGLVIVGEATCIQHRPEGSKTMRCGHPAAACPGEEMVEKTAPAKAAYDAEVAEANKIAQRSSI